MIWNDNLQLTMAFSIDLKLKKDKYNKQIAYFDFKIIIIINKNKITSKIQYDI